MSITFTIDDGRKYEKGWLTTIWVNSRDRERERERLTLYHKKESSVDMDNSSIFGKCIIMAKI